MYEQPRFEVEESDGVTVVRVIGEAGGLPAEQALKQALSACVSRAAPGALVVADLGQAYDFTNDACGVLLSVYIQASKRDVRFRLAAVPREALRRLEPSGLVRILPIYESVAAAREGAAATP